MYLFLVVDGSNLAHRLYHVHKDNLKAAHDLSKIMERSLRASIEKYGASHCAIAFDNSTPTWRHQEYELYKAGRAHNEEIVPMLDAAKTFFTSTGQGIIAPPGYEADDVIATLVSKAVKLPRLILSNDRDLFQLVAPDVEIVFDKLRLTAEGVTQQMGVKPEQIPDFKGLAGDPTDNIPGVDRIGKQTAKQILSQYPTIEAIYENPWRVHVRHYQRLMDGREAAFLFKRLATLDRDLALNTSLASFHL